MAANDHDNAPHGDNIISQGETVENRPLASEPVPDPEDIERQSERQAKIAALPNRSIDPKKAVVLAAVACGAIVLGFSTIDAMRSDPTEKAEKAEKPDERQLANYDPKSIIAPSLLKLLVDVVVQTKKVEGRFRVTEIYFDPENRL